MKYRKLHAAIQQLSTSGESLTLLPYLKRDGHKAGSARCIYGTDGWLPGQRGADEQTLRNTAHITANGVIRYNRVSGKILHLDIFYSMRFCNALRKFFYLQLGEFGFFP